eukprot:gene16144-7506_t
MPLSDEIGAVNYCDESETSTDDEDNDLDEITIGKKVEKIGKKKGNGAIL